MPEHEASRTLVKSAPELWAECSDAASLARHLGAFGEIRITKLEPESAVAWEGDVVRGTVTLEPSGWGTRVTLTAIADTRPGAKAPPADAESVSAAEPAPDAEVEPEPVAVAEPEPAAIDEPEPAAVDEPEPAAIDEPEPAATDEPARGPKGGLWVRLRARLGLGHAEGVAHHGDGPRPASVPAATPVSTPVTTGSPPAAAAPPPVVTAAAPAAPPALGDQLAVLTRALDSLGMAHHRPYSRG
ncbi:MAG: hypothetical protein ACLP50_14550 [Solirubrobacteraceae bacterium]